MTLLELILALTVIWLVLIFISTRINTEKKGILIAPLILIWQTERFNTFFTKLSANKTRKFWKAFGNTCSFISLELFFILPLLLGINLILAATDRPAPIFTENPLFFVNVDIIILIIPALLFALVMHELMKGLIATSEGAKINKIGIIIVGAIIGIFVKIESQKIKKLSNRAKLRILSTSQLFSLILVIILLLLQSLSSTFISPFYGNTEGALIVNVIPDSPAEQVDLKRGDIIVGIKIIEFRTITGYYLINSSSDLIVYLRNIPVGTQFIIETKGGDVAITGIIPPARSKVITGSFIGVVSYDYKAPKIGILSEFLPYWIEIEFKWLINFNLILGLYNLLPLPFSDGKKILEILLDNISIKKQSLILKSSYIVSGMLIIANLFIILLS